MLHGYDLPWLNSRLQNALSHIFQNIFFNILQILDYRWKVLSKGLLFCFRLLYHTEFISFSWDSRPRNCRFFVLEEQVARFDEGVLPSALSIFHDDSSFRSRQFIKRYIYILSFCYWGNIVITVFIICLMVGRNGLVSRMALPTIAR